MIIFIANQFIGNRLSTGGDILAIELAKRVKQKITILAPFQMHPELLRSLGKVELINTDNFLFGSGTASSLLGGVSTTLHYLARSWSSTVWLLKNIKNEDTIYLTGDFICNTLPAWILKRRKPNIKVLANFYHRNPVPRDRFGNNNIVSYFSRLLQEISLKIIKRIAYKVFVLSKIGAQELRKDGFPQSQIVISGAGINIVKQKPARAKKRDQIVFIGRMNVTKGAFDLIDIFYLVNLVKPDLELIMIGGTSAEDLKKLNELVRQYKLEGKVNYLGFVSEEVKNQILSESKALVLPSKEEGFGIVVMEALAHNTPVICYDLPALKAIFSKYKSVNFVKSFMKAEFADKIIKVTTRAVTKTQEKIQTWEGVYKIQSHYF